MHKNLIKIREKAQEIMGNTPAERARIIEAIAEAQAAKAAAQQTIEATLNESEFIAAEKALNEADNRENFNRRLLEHINTTPRMSEENYNRATEACKDLILSERDKARATIDKAMQQIKEALDEYKELAGDIDITLRELDAAANVLQTKYGPEWERHALRFAGTGKAHQILCEDPNPEKPGAFKYSIYCAAWGAVDKAYPERRF